MHREGMTQVVQPWFPAVDRHEAKVTRQHSEGAVYRTTGATLFPFVNEEWRLRTLLHSRPGTEVAVGQQCHLRAVGQRNQTRLEVLGLADMKDAFFKVDVFHIQADQFAAPQPGRP